jgi:hypothetical protein
MKKSRMMKSLLAFTLFTVGCVADGSDDPIETAQDQAVLVRPPGVAWYYTCSNDLLVCRPGYGAVEAIHDDACGSLLRIKCQLGAENP